MEETIRKLHREWKVYSYLTETEYTKFVKDAYQVLVERAKLGKTIFYGELPGFREIRERFGDGVRKVIGFIVGACSEYELKCGHPPISAIAIGQDTSEPGQGFYGLSNVPSPLCWDSWEGQGIEPPKIVIRKREEFWLSKLQKTLEYWGKHHA